MDAHRLLCAGQLGALKLQIYQPSGNVHEVDAKPTSCVRDVKSALQAVSGIPADEQRLICHGKELEDLDYILEHAPGAQEFLLLRRSPEHAELLSQLVQDEYRLAGAPEEVTANADLMLSVARQNPQAFRYVSEELRADPSFVLAALRHRGECQRDIHGHGSLVLQYASMQCRENRECVLAAIADDPSAFAYAAGPLTSDRDFVLEVLRRDGSMLRFVPADFQADPQMVLAAGSKSVMFASQEIKANCALTVVGLRLDPMWLPFQSDRRWLWMEPSIVQAAVMEHGLALEHAALCLRSDREVVLPAVQQEGLALQYASKSMRADHEIVLAAVQQQPLALEFASKGLRDDPAIAIAAVQIEGCALEFASARLRGDRGVVLAAVCQNGLALEWAQESLRSDCEVVLAAVEQDGLAVQFASEALRRDEEIVLSALRQDMDSRAYVPKDFALQVCSKFGLELLNESESGEESSQDSKC